MSIVAVDLAAKYSAAVWMDVDAAAHEYEVLDQWDSWQKTETEFIDQTTAKFEPVRQWARPDALVIEDLPHGVRYMTNTKDVCRLQGRIVERMQTYGALPYVLFVPPAEWRAHYSGMGRGTGPDVVVPVAAKYGYEPPDLSSRVGKGERATARKVATDYCAAYLIGRWALHQRFWSGSYDAARTSRYTKE